MNVSLTNYGSGQRYAFWKDLRLRNWIRTVWEVLEFPEIGASPSGRLCTARRHCRI